MSQQSQKSQFVLIASIAILALGIGGWAHGVTTDRWGVPVSVVETSSRVRNLPVQIGPWVGTDSEMDQRQLTVAGASGALARRYENRETGEIVQINLLAGRPGPMSLHEPTVCFAGSGLVQIEKVSKAKKSGQLPRVSGQFSKTVFRAPQTRDAGMVTLWAWSRDGSIWEAPESPRSSFAGAGHLFKLYIIGSASKNDAGETALSPAASEFAGLLLDSLHNVLTEPVKADHAG